MTANGLSNIVSIDYKNKMWCTFQIDLQTGVIGTEEVGILFLWMPTLYTLKSAIPFFLIPPKYMWPFLPGLITTNMQNFGTILILSSFSF